MKLYMIYAIVDTKFYYSILRNLLPTQHPFELINDTDKCTGLYAWTTEKSLLKQFSKERDMNKFKVLKANIDKDDFPRFNLDMIDLKLEDREYVIPLTKSHETVHYVTTKNEYVQVTDYGRENLYYFKPFMDVDYMIFNEEIIDALDIINYTSIYDTECLCGGESDEEVTERMELANFNASFNLTTNGHKLVEMYENTAATLIYLFSPLFIREG